ERQGRAEARVRVLRERRRAALGDGEHLLRVVLGDDPRERERREREARRVALEVLEERDGPVPLSGERRRDRHVVAEPRVASDERSPAPRRGERGSRALPPDRLGDLEAEALLLLASLAEPNADDREAEEAGDLRESEHRVLAHEHLDVL